MKTIKKRYLDLKKWRKKHNISQMTLYRETKLSYFTIRRFESEEITEDEIDFNNLYKLAKYFNVRPEELFSERSIEINE